MHRLLFSFGKMCQPRVMWRLSILVVALTIPGSLQVTCIVRQYSEVAAAVASCTDILIDRVIVPANQKMVLNLLDGTTLSFRSLNVFEPGNLDDWLMEISGNDITIIGEAGSLIHGHGEKYWDGHGGSGGVTKSKLMRIRNVNNAKFRNINLLNCPMFCTGIEHATNLDIDGWNIDCSAGDKLGKNTDGIGISWSKNVRINNAVIHNQDQCVYVNQGSDMVFTNLHCTNSHGICTQAGFSATSVEENTVKNISFENVRMEGGLTGAQILVRANPGGPGEISDITFKNVEISGPTMYGLSIDMDYLNKGNPNNQLQVRNVHMTNIHGTVAKSAKNVEIICGSGCSNFYFSDINISGSKYPNSCNFKPQGFNC